MCIFCVLLFLGLVSAGRGKGVRYTECALVQVESAASPEASEETFFSANK